MNIDEKEDTRIYKVVLNHEEQYSIWPADRENPLGWNDAGKSGPKAECLAYIKEVWTDMRPLSLRKRMEEAKANEAAARSNGKAATADGKEATAVEEAADASAKPAKPKESKGRKRSSSSGASAATSRKRTATPKSDGATV